MTEAEPADYTATLVELGRRLHEARFTLQRRANAELVAQYWRIGATVLRREQTSGWGAESLARLADDLSAEFPTMHGFSVDNLRAMLSFAAVWPERGGIAQQPVGQLPWSHIVLLLERLDDQGLREWYAGKDVQHTWSRHVLLHHLTTRLHDRDGAAPSNFAAALTHTDSDLAHQLFGDPHTAGFLSVDADAPARESEER